MTSPSAPSAHWSQLWDDRDEGDVSWFQETPRRSLQLVGEVAANAAAPILDAGGGASRLVDGLVAAGFRDVTVLDVAPAALAQARRRLGSRAEQVTWVVADVLGVDLARQYAVWHDRAVFHFLVAPADRERYVAQLARAVAPGGHAIIATFAPHGPSRCSGLPVCRYGPDELAAALGTAFEPQRFAEETHVTPAGGAQPFVYGVFRRRG